MAKSATYAFSNLFAYPFANLFGAFEIPEKAKREASAKVRKVSIHSRIREYDAQGVVDALIIAAIQTEFPASAFARDLATAKKHLAWLRNHDKVVAKAKQLASQA